MKFIKCKDDLAKLQAIRSYCKDQIGECNYKIKWFENEQESILDYEYEIHEQKTRRAHFETIVKIIEADEFTSVMVY